MDEMNLDNDRSVSVEGLLDLAAWLTANNLSSHGIQSLRELMRGIQIRLFDNFNHVCAAFLYPNF